MVMQSTYTVNVSNITKFDDKSVHCPLSTHSNILDCVSDTTDQSNAQSMNRCIAFTMVITVANQRSCG